MKRMEKEILVEEYNLSYIPLEELLEWIKEYEDFFKKIEYFNKLEDESVTIFNVLDLRHELYSTIVFSTQTSVGFHCNNMEDDIPVMYNLKKIFDEVPHYLNSYQRDHLEKCKDLFFTNETKQFQFLNDVLSILLIKYIAKKKYCNELNKYYNDETKIVLGMKDITLHPQFRQFCIKFITEFKQFDDRYLPLSDYIIKATHKALKDADEYSFIVKEFDINEVNERIKDYNKKLLEYIDDEILNSLNKDILESNKLSNESLFIFNYFFMKFLEKTLKKHIKSETLIRLSVLSLDIQ